MYYPWLDVPVLTAPMLIAIVALFHVFVSHFAVGGGILLAWENSRALKNGDNDYRAYLKKLVGFFLTLTLTFGAVTGVAIWFVIGVASPLATEVLIKTFVWGWAIEWCFFFLEIVSGLAFYYFWEKLSPRASVFVGWTYAFSAWISLVLITAITAFMLNTSGLIKDWEETSVFWHAFLNVQFIPQTIARSGCALTLSSFYFLLHASLFAGSSEIRERVTRHMVLPSFLGIFTLILGVVGWAWFLPESSLATIERCAATNIFTGMFFGIVTLIIVLLFCGPTINPRSTSVATSTALLCLGIAGVSVGEFMREAVRKPYIVDRVVYSDQLMRDDIAKTRQDGILYTGVWTNYLLDRLQAKEEYLDLKISSEAWLQRPSKRVKRITPSVDSTDEGIKEQNELNNPPMESSTVDEELEEQIAKDKHHVFINQTVASILGGRCEQETVCDVFDTNATLSQCNREIKSFQGDERTDLSEQNVILRDNERIVGVGMKRQAVLIVHNDTNLAVTEDKQQIVIPPVSGDFSHSGLHNDSVFDDNIETNDSEIAEQTFSSIEQDEEIFGIPAYGNPDLLKLSVVDRLLLGRAVFLHHCNCCHAEKKGYSAISPMITGLTKDDLKYLALELNYSHYYMPPWAGTEVEAELLAEYLVSISSKYPRNIFQKKKSKVLRSVKDEDESIDIGKD